MRSLSPSELQATIDRDGSLTELLQEQFPMIPVGFVRGILTPQEREVLARLDERGFDALLDVFLAEVPDIGEILWANREWYLREIAALRDAIVGADS